MTSTTGRLSSTRRMVTLAAAQTGVAAAQAKAEELGLSAAIGVVDAAGQVKAFAVMDGCPLLPARVARQKAWSAVSFGVSTNAWWEIIKDDPPLLHGITHQEDLIIFGGGVVVEDGGEVVGAVGVSGGTSEQDHEIATAAVAAMGESHQGGATND